MVGEIWTNSNGIFKINKETGEIACTVSVKLTVPNSKLFYEGVKHNKNLQLNDICIELKINN